MTLNEQHQTHLEQERSQRQLNLQEILANPLVVLANRNGLAPVVDTETLLYLQQQRNNLGIELCQKLVSAGNPEALAAQAQDIAYIKGKLDMLCDILIDAKVNTDIITVSGD